MTINNPSRQNFHKSASWNVARVLLIGLVLLIALDLIFFFIIQAEQRSELKEYYENDSYYSRYYTQKEINELIDERLDDYSLSRVLGLLVKELPFVILLVYCLFFDNRYAGKFIYLLTTGIFAWVFGIAGIVMLIGADSPLSQVEEFLPVLYYLLACLFAMGLGGMMLVLFLGKLILPDNKMSTVASRLPFVLMGLLGALVILLLCQIEEFNATVIYNVFYLLAQEVFLYALYLLWQSESSHACRVIPRMHGAAELQYDLQALMQQSGDNPANAAYAQQKASILKTFARLAPPAAYQSTLTKMPAAKHTPVPAPAVKPAPAAASTQHRVPDYLAARSAPADDKTPAAPAPKVTAATPAAPAAQASPAKPAAEKAPAAPNNPASWICPSCNTRNPIAQETCYYCKTRKPSAAPAAQASPAKPAAEKAPAAPAKEPWACPVCGTKNPASLTVCNNCHEKRSYSDRWACKYCGTKNPPHRGSCSHCGAYK